MASVELKFGSLALDSTNNITIKDISEKTINAVKSIAIPKTDGGIAEEGKLGAKQLY